MVSFSAIDFNDYNFWWLLIITFIGGLGLNLTPCIYPILPITISYFSSYARANRKTLIASGLAYCLGMVVMYSSLGVIMSLSGGMLGEALTHPIIILVMAGMVVALALSFFDIWNFRIPVILNKVNFINYQGIGEAFLMGLSLGVLLGPCVGPFVLGLMTHVASVGQVFYGLSIFFAFSMGLALPMTILAFFSGLLTHLPKAGEWMIWIRRFFGVLLLLMAIHISRSVIGEIVYNWSIAILGTFGAIYLGFINKNGNSKNYFLIIKKIIGIVGVIAAIFFWWASIITIKPVCIAWRPFTPTVLANSIQAGRPVIIDFSASWCQPCRKLEAETFFNTEVQAVMKEFDTIKVDVSNNPGSEVKDLMRKWQVRGVPTVAFLDRSGEIINELTLVGFEGPDNFLVRLHAFLAKTRAILEER